MTDRYYEKVALLLHSTGADGSTSFIDSSPVPQTVTPFGNVQISTAQSKFDLSSMYFDGTGDYLSLDSSTYWDLDGPFTLEAFVYVTAHTGAWSTILSRFFDPSASGYRIITNANGTQFNFVDSVAGGPVAVTGPSLTIGVWNHIAVTYDGTTYRLFINGAMGTSSYVGGRIRSVTDVGGTMPLLIGSTNGGVWFFSGYIDELRITKGVSRYDADFISPVEPFANSQTTGIDPYWDKVVLAMHMDGTNGSNSFVDLRGNTTTAIGTSRISTAQSKFGGASAYFGTPADLVKVKYAANGGLEFGKLNFTIDYWVNPIVAVNNLHLSRRVIESSVVSYLTYFDTQGHACALLSTDGISWQGILGGTSINAPGVWCHIALVRNDRTVTLYVNGVAEHSINLGFNALVSSTADLAIGADLDGGSGLNGYIDDLRITRGVARYTKNFTPPTQAFLNYATILPELIIPTYTYDSHYANVSLLLNGNGANGTVIFTDSSATPKTVTPYGNAQISTTQSKYDGASMYFDGSGDYLLIPNSADLSFGVGDFTIEAYVNVADLSGYKVVFGGSVPGEVSFYIANNQLELGNWGIAGIAGSGYNFITANAWHHIAVSRNGDIIRLFIDGSNVAEVTFTQSVNYSGELCVGADTARASLMNGYIDDLRITKGIGRYSSNFIPYMSFASATDVPVVDPIVYDDLYDSVVLLLRGNGTNNATTFVDISATPKTVIGYGNASISTAQSKFGGSSIYFDGSGDYLIAANCSLGSTDFTVELWVNWSDLANRGLIHFTTGLLPSATTGLAIGYDGAAAKFTVYANSIANQLDYTPTINTWTHVAVARSGSSLSVFIDGVFISNIVDNSDYSSLSTVYVGGYYSADYLFNGYIDELRITQGTARYTGNFTPPILAFGNTQTPVVTPPVIPVTYDDFYSNVTLLLHGNGTDGSLIFTDSSNYVKQLYPYDDASISTAQSKFGGASMYFGGSGGCAVLGSVSADYDFGSLDFTIEASVFITGSLSIYQPILSNTRWTLLVDSDQGGLVSFGCIVAGDAVVVTSAVPAVVNQWMSIAVTRSGSSLSMFIDGVLTNTSVISGPISASNQPLGVGGNSRGGGAALALGTFTGYIDELRITKGIARYTSNYTLPTVAFANVQGTQQPSNPNLYDPYYNNVELLLHTVGNLNSTTFVDSSRWNSAIANYTSGNSSSNGGTTLVGHSGSQFHISATSAYFSLTSVPLLPELTLGYAIGKNDFTIEFSLYVNSGNFSDTPSNIFSLSYGPPGNLNSLQIGFGDDDTFGRLGFSIQSNLFTSMHCTEDTRTSLEGSWYHFAMVRQRDIVSIYKNGTCVPTGLGDSVNVVDFEYVDSTNIVLPTIALIGGRSDLYLTEFRFTTGVARYVSTVDPVLNQPVYVIDNVNIFADQVELFSTDEDIDPYYNNVELLLRADGAVGSYVFEDKSRYLSSIGNISTISYSSATTLYPPTSAYFPLIALPIEPAITPGYEFGSGNFTIEFALYVNSGYIADGSSAVFAIEYGTGDDALVLQIAFDSDVGSGRMMFCVSNFDDTTLHRSLDTRDTLMGAWHQFAMVRSDGQVSIYKDGVPLLTGVGASVTATNDSYYDATVVTAPTRVRVGSGDLFISELRVTNGIARYLAAYTPPARRFSTLSPYVLPPGPVEPPAPSPPDQYYNNVVLLLHTVGTALDETFIDSSKHAVYVRNQGINRIENTQFLFSPTSAYFPPSVIDYYNWGSFPLKPDVVPEYNVGSGDFTLEFAVYVNADYAGDGYNNLFTILYGVPGTGEGSLKVAFDDTQLGGRLGFSINSNLIANTHTTQHTRQSLMGAWHQFAMVRREGIVTIYKNGSRQNSDTGLATGQADVSYYDITDISSVFEIQVGGNGDTYMTEIRFTAGIARYLGEYTPATQIFGGAGVAPITLESRLVELATAIGVDIKQLQIAINLINANAPVPNAFTTPAQPSGTFPTQDVGNTGLEFFVTQYEHPNQIPQYGVQIRRAFSYSDVINAIDAVVSSGAPNATSTITTVSYATLDGRISNGMPVYWQARYIDIFGKVSEWSYPSSYLHYDSQAEIP